jgi:isopentenyl diphosphate isomerase/L-lactate dehydrogenase-like FMN-dependent dehydrogenase
MTDVSQAYNIADLRRLAKRRLPRMIFDFIDGGAEDEVTLRANRDAYERLRFAPRVLRNVVKVDTSCEVLGGASKHPIVVAPTGGVGFAWPGGDLAIARAAAAFGLPCCLSTNTTATMEAIAEAAGGRLWYQLYVLRDREFTDTLVARAAAVGCEALAVTVDLASGGKRERDMHNRFTVPFRMTAWHLWQALIHPRWSAAIVANGGVPTFENLVGMRTIADPSASSIAASVGREIDASLNEADLVRYRDLWKGKLLVKGVERADDAARLVALGVDGIWVSNHGGRQLDGAAATLDALPDIVAAVGGRVPVIVDSGVRRGADALKARALGAQAVAVGRAMFYGTAAAGEAGALRALTILTDELERTMRLCGVAGLTEVGPDLLHRA